MLVQHSFPVPSRTLAFGISGGQRLLTGERRNHDSRERLLRRIRERFREMPCMRLTDAQSARLFGLSQAVCGRILATLVNEGTLWIGLDRTVRRPRARLMSGPVAPVPAVVAPAAADSFPARADFSMRAGAPCRTAGTGHGPNHPLGAPEQ